MNFSLTDKKNCDKLKEKDNKGRMTAMNKKLKIILAVLISVVLIFGAASAIFFAVYPMSPKVEIKSAESRIKNTDELFVASFNTAAPWGNLLNGTYTKRRAHLFAEQVNNIMPDTLGVQEMNSDWVEKMEELLPQYSYYGVKRGGDGSEKTSEMSGIFYLKDKFILIDSGTFWISETPKKESYFEGAGCNRVCSYVVLENRETNVKFVHFNTHLDNVSEEAQNLGGKLIAQYADEISKKYEGIYIVVTGDFNQYSNGKGCAALEQNGYTNVGKSFGKDNLLTYNAWTRDKEGSPIDFIFINSEFSANDYSVVHYDNVKSNVSDHYMITATLEF